MKMITQKHLVKENQKGESLKFGSRMITGGKVFLGILVGIGIYGEVSYRSGFWLKAVVVALATGITYWVMTYTSVVIDETGIWMKSRLKEKKASWDEIISTSWVMDWVWFEDWLGEKKLRIETKNGHMILPRCSQEAKLRDLVKKYWGRELPPKFAHLTR